MKKLLALTSIITALIICLALVVGEIERSAIAQNEQPDEQVGGLSEAPGTSKEASKENTQTKVTANVKDKEAGLWREGKAVFSDVKVIDTLGLLKYARGYKPAQPIKFSHVTHVKQNKMECTYCHSGVTKSPYATIPAVETCMGCHKAVKTESPEIKKLKKYYDEGKPIPWEPVHHLPEHVYFTHERHIKAGVGCQSCHGQVPEMEEVEKVSSLKMGFCVSCHRENGASIDCLVCHQ